MDAIEHYILQPWWQSYTAFKPEFEGNIRCYKDWRPREGIVLYAVLLLFVIIFTSILSIYLSYSSLLLASFILILGLFSSGFAYTNFVTSARNSIFIGKHGTYRDILVVVTLIPVIVWLNIYTPGFHRFLFTPLDQTILSSHSIMNDSVKVGSLSVVLYSHISLDLGFFLGVHVVYITRPGSLLSGSFALSSSANSFTLLNNIGFLCKLFFILLNIHFHFLWCASRGELLLGVLLWHLPWLAIACIALWMKKRWYLHLHHWFLGLVLMRAAQQTPAPRIPLFDLFLTGLAASQFVEGAARWSCAPLFHKRDDKKGKE